jgi:hypothetical protein
LGQPLFKIGRVDSMSGAASDSVSLISFLHFGQMMVGSAISGVVDCYIGGILPTGSRECNVSWHTYKKPYS